MAVQVDSVALFGSGTPPEPRGMVNFSNVQSVTLNGALANYSPPVQADENQVRERAETRERIHPIPSG